MGDDGQHDPQVYADAAREHPDRVEAIAIRQLTPAQHLVAHGTTTPPDGEAAPDDDAPTVTVAAPDGSGLRDALRERGVLGP